MKVTATQIRGEARGDDLHIRVGEIRLETTGKLPAVKYTALGVAVAQRGKLARASWDFRVRGELSAAKPSVTFSWQEFVLPQAGKQCESGGCEVRLQLRVEPASGEAHAEHTNFAAVAVTWAPPVARKVAPQARGPARPGQKPGSKPPAKPAPQPYDKELYSAIVHFAQKRQQQADEGLARVLATVFKGRVVGPRQPQAAQFLYQTANRYGSEQRPAQQLLALQWSLAIIEPLPPAEARKALDGGFHKEMVARSLADNYWRARNYERALEYYDRAYSHVADLGLQPPTANLLYALNSAGRMACACQLGKWAIADAAMRELKDRAPRVDATTRQRLEYWIRTGEPRLAARKC